MEPEFRAPGTEFHIQLLGEMHPATVLAEAAYDPSNEKLRV